MSGEPPPLEDMSEHFLLKRPTKAAHPSSVDLGDKALEEAALAAKRKIYKNLENSDGVRDQVSKTAVSTEEPSRAEKNSSNFGFQAGFLNNSKPRPVQEKSNVEVIKPKNKPETSPLVFEPVQSALQDFINESSNSND